MEAAYRKKHGRRKPQGLKDFATPLMDKWDREAAAARRDMAKRFEAILGEPAPKTRKK
jgi:hypothetical protein